MQLYLLLLALFSTCYLAGSHGLGAIRFLYLLGCVGVAYQGLKLGAAHHFEVLVVLFAISPFLRRIVDYSCGYDPSGMMLAGPLLAAALPAMTVIPALLSRYGPLRGVVGPYVVMVVCLVYSAVLSVFYGNYGPAIIGFCKPASVLVYGCWLLTSPHDPRQFVQQAARIFLIILPVLGLYGIAQYLDPSPADRFWMISSRMLSIGQPEPRQVRVFGMLNSPAAMGNFAVFGLVLVGFLRSRWEILLSSGPVVVVLLLTQFRTAWIALVVAVVFTMFFSRTSSRSTMLTLVVVVVGTFAVAATPLGDVIFARLQTVDNAPSDDGSGKARIDEYRFLFENIDSYLVGFGNGGQRALLQQDRLTTQGTDGLIVWSIETMGVFAGLSFDTAVVWAAVRGLYQLRRRSEPEYILAGALALGQIVTIPLNNPAGAEFGILFWSVVAVTLRTPVVRAVPALAWQRPLRSAAGDA